MPFLSSVSHRRPLISDQYIVIHVDFYLYLYIYIYSRKKCQIGFCSFSMPGLEAEKFQGDPWEPLQKAEVDGAGSLRGEDAKIELRDFGVLKDG